LTIRGFLFRSLLDSTYILRRCYQFREAAVQVNMYVVDGFGIPLTVRSSDDGGNCGDDGAEQRTYGRNDGDEDGRGHFPVL
jgi:hypothetical protein